MSNLDAIFADLAAHYILVDGLRQTVDGQWEARTAIRYAPDGRHIQHMAKRATPYDALANCLDLCLWSLANPPKTTGQFRGTLRELLGLGEAPTQRQLTPDEIKSLEL